MGQEKEKKSLEKRGYIVGRLLGQGAFSRVYCVEKQGTGRRAACKISENIRLIEREAKILKKLRHPLFPEYYENWREGKTGFLLIEEIVGENMADLIRQGRKLSIYKIAEMGMELAEGLLYLHESRPAILFRDVKPENIMLREDGRMKLLDFGCACEPDTDDRTRAGTPGFAAPEQFLEGGEQTHLCDVYGLGRTLQELLWTGTRQSGTVRLSERQWLRERQARRHLEKLLTACVEKEPSARPADMRVVMAALFHLCAPALRRRHGGWHISRNIDWNGSRNRRWNRGRNGYSGSDFWQEGVICQKNIRKSSWKTS